MGIFHEDRDRVVVAVERDKTLWQLINEFLAAYRIRTEAWRSDDGADSHTLQAILTTVQNLDRKVDQFMATQEERLQAIATKIDEVLADLAALKANNPQIEDEISAIEQKLSITQPSGETPTT